MSSLFHYNLVGVFYGTATIHRLLDNSHNVLLVYHLLFFSFDSIRDQIFLLFIVKANLLILNAPEMKCC